ncbi:MAG: PIG-L family deacetylase [bacterium]|nr:PIG-L family deacetylase [bacterium]
MTLAQFLKTVIDLSVEHFWLIAVFLGLWWLWAFGLGLLGGWLLAKGSLARFPKIKSKDKILILAPHIDDEIIGCGGIIQQAKNNNAQVLVVYATNGDGNRLPMLGDNKGFNPNDFITLGETRMEEAKKATTLLGLEKENLIFLGYPDSGLKAMLNKYFYPDKPFTSPGTRFNYNPYRGTWREGQLYTGSNLIKDLGKIISDFQPTIIFCPHPRDNHGDHRGLSLFLEKTLQDENRNIKLYGYLIHFKFYPPKKKLKIHEFLYPPRRLFSREGWYSFDLSADQLTKKFEAVCQNFSQLKGPHISDLLKSFVKRNEIFEELELDE